MDKKKYAIAAIGAFVFVFVFDMLWHEFLMKGMYQATASVWRPEEEYNMGIMTLSQFFFAGILTLIYTQVGKHLPCKHGVQFGVFAGLLLATFDLAAYGYLPISFKICSLWMLASVLRCVGSGAVIAFLYKEK